MSERDRDRLSLADIVNDGLSKDVRPTVIPSAFVSYFTVEHNRYGLPPIIVDTSIDSPNTPQRKAL